jgi:predicted SnoaL-like aldol condensation-catalyzing enzyme
MPDLEQNNENIKAFYDLMFNQCRPPKPSSATPERSYIQHNPHSGDGKQEFSYYFERMAAEYTGKHVEFVRASAEGNHVIPHCHQTWPGDVDCAGIDIFRLDDDGKVLTTGTC